LFLLFTYILSTNVGRLAKLFTLSNLVTVVPCVTVIELGRTPALEVADVESPQPKKACLTRTSLAAIVVVIVVEESEETVMLNVFCARVVNGTSRHTNAMARIRCVIVFFLLSQPVVSKVL
jgi:hypothetical protein